VRACVRACVRKTIIPFLWQYKPYEGNQSALIAFPVGCMKPL